MTTTPQSRDDGLRRAAVSRLMHLAQKNSLAGEHIRTVADSEPRPEWWTP